MSTDIAAALTRLTAADLPRLISFAAAADLPPCVGRYWEALARYELDRRAAVASGDAAPPPVPALAPDDVPHATEAAQLLLGFFQDDRRTDGSLLVRLPVALAQPALDPLGRAEAAFDQRVAP